MSVSNLYLKLDELPFPLLQRIEQLRERVSHKEEIRFMEHDGERAGYTTCSYIVATASTFDDGYSQECRGIVFGPKGEVVSRPLHKFFNINERDSTRFENIDWSKVVRIMEKRDGSMIHTVKMPAFVHGFDIKSKKSFTSDVANAAREHFTPDHVLLCKHVVEQDQTAVFEFTSPTARIVIGYKETSLHLLHVRDNQTGRYASQQELEELSAKFNVPLVASVPLVQPIKEQVRYFMTSQQDDTVEGLEGWVLQFENGDMVKLKTKWYMDRHGAFTFLRRRDVARMVLEETLDDLKSKLVGDGIDITPILEIEEAVGKEIRSLELQVDELFASTTGKDRKTVALENMGHPLFGLLMQKYSGKEPDVVGYYTKHRLDDLFDLTQLNLLDTVAEAE